MLKQITQERGLHGEVIQGLEKLGAIRERKANLNIVVTRRLEDKIHIRFDEEPRSCEVKSNQRLRGINARTVVVNIDIIIALDFVMSR